jgi:hypothetical protein
MAEGNGLTAKMRERLERIVIPLLEIAARRELDPALQNEFMRLADQVSSLIEGSPQGPRDPALFINPGPPILEAPVQHGRVAAALRRGNRPAIRP